MNRPRLHRLALDSFTSAENAVNERLAQTPELYLLALAQFATAADTEVVSVPITLEVYMWPLATHALSALLPTIPLQPEGVLMVILQMDDHQAQLDNLNLSIFSICIDGSTFNFPLHFR